MRGGLWRYELRVQYIEQLPIAIHNESAKTGISELTERLADPSATSRLVLEQELQDRVTALYGLTAEERKIVAGLTPAPAAGEPDEED